ALCRYRNIWNIDLRFRPAFLGGIMQQTGNKPPAMLPKRGEYLLKDMKRMAKYYQVPLRMSADAFQQIMGTSSLTAMRFITAIDMTNPQYLEPLSREFWMRFWSQHEDISQPENLLTVARQAGLSAELSQKALEMISSATVKDRLKETTAEALKYGAFGMPAVVAHYEGEPHLFFGSDRLELLGSFIVEPATLLEGSNLLPRREPSTEQYRNNQEDIPGAAHIAGFAPKDLCLIHMFYGFSRTQLIPLFLLYVFNANGTTPSPVEAAGSSNPIMLRLRSCSSSKRLSKRALPCSYLTYQCLKRCRYSRNQDNIWLNLNLSQRTKNHFKDQNQYSCTVYAPTKILQLNLVTKEIQELQETLTLYCVTEDFFFSCLQKESRSSTKHKEYKEQAKKDTKFTPTSMQRERKKTHNTQNCPDTDLRAKGSMVDQIRQSEKGHPKIKVKVKFDFKQLGKKKEKKKGKRKKHRDAFALPNTIVSYSVETAENTTRIALLGTPVQL
ncbi:Glutathione S-transferase kappa 1, partial [Lamprotornis superbus]